MDISLGRNQTYIEDWDWKLKIEISSMRTKKQFLAPFVLIKLQSFNFQSSMRSLISALPGNLSNVDIA